MKTYSVGAFGRTGNPVSGGSFRTLDAAKCRANEMMASRIFASVSVWEYEGDEAVDEVYALCA